MTTQTEAQHYPSHDAESLGQDYINHISAMTTEGLCAKSSIAIQLAWRDAEIRRLEAENARMRSELERPMSSVATVLVHDNARLRAEVQRLDADLSMATVLHARLTHEAIKAQARCIELEAEVQALRGAVPAGWKLVPVSLLKRAESSLGSFCSDLGWADKDMEVMDDISGMLAANPQVQRGNHESKG